MHRHLLRSLRTQVPTSRASEPPQYSAGRTGSPHLGVSFNMYAASAFIAPDAGYLYGSVDIRIVGLCGTADKDLPFFAYRERMSHVSKHLVE